MKRSNRIALVIVLAVLLGLPAGLFGYQALRTQAAGVRVIDVKARAPAAGGFAPDRIELVAGQRVRLRLSSPDVVHGFTVPGLNIDVKEIVPGRPVEIDVLPQQAGRYAFSCTRWCGVDHWRMRGVIEVTLAPGSGPSQPSGETQAEAPLYQQLGIDLDAGRPEPAALPAEGAPQPSAARGAALGRDLPAALRGTDRRLVSPADAFVKLRSNATTAGLDDAQTWDMVAWAWLRDVPEATLARGRELYTRDCAACHGPEGLGNGPAGRDLPGLQAAAQSGSAGGGEMGSAAATGHAMAGSDVPSGPAKFTDARRMLAASDVLLQGKILRGGMGTGMPEFGSLYSDEDLWAVLAYVRTFLLQK